MSKKNVITLFTIIIILAIFGVTFFLVDFNFVVRNEEPKLCINTNVYNDGKTKEYIGLGYKIIRYNILTENKTDRFGSWFLMYDANLNVKEENQNILSYNHLYDIIGEVTSFDEKELILNVKSNSSSSKYEDAILKISSDTIITKNGKKIYKSDLKVGNKVKVLFENIVANSVPLEAVAANIDIEN